jgi:hypothetical protein
VVIFSAVIVVEAETENDAHEIAVQTVEHNDWDDGGDTGYIQIIHTEEVIPAKT